VYEQRKMQIRDVTPNLKGHSLNHSTVHLKNIKYTGANIVL